MKKNRIWYLLVVIIAALSIFACSDDAEEKTTTIVVIPDGDNPVVNIFQPVNNSVYNVIDAVEVKAFVADADSTLEVSLYVNDTLLSTNEALPWNFNWREAIIDDGNLPPAVIEEQGSYKLTIKAIDVTGNESMSAPVYVHLTYGNTPPEIPGTPSPVVGADDVQVINPTLSWESAGTDTLSYEIAFGNLPDLSDATIDDTLTVKEYQIPGDPLSFETEFFWQVTVKDSFYTVMSPIWDFTTILPLDLPQEPTPDNEDEDIEITDIDFSWDCVNYDPEAPITYDFYFGLSNDNLEVKAEGLTVEEFTYTWTLAYNTEYFWRVKAIDDYFPNGQLSPLWSFTTRHVINNPNTPVPGNDSIGNPITGLALGWDCTDELAEAMTYQVIVSTETNFELEDYQIVNVDSLANPAYTIPAELIYSNRYYWRVYAKTAADSLEGPLWTFRTVNPISNVEPLHEEEDLSILDVTFEWAMMDIGMAVTYDFYISTNDQLDALDPKVDSINVNTLVYPPSTDADPDTLAIDTTYYWRIRAKHGVPGTSEYFVINSSVWSFDTKANPIDEPDNQTPDQNETGIAVVNPSFSWDCSHVDGTAMTYDFWFGPDEYSLVEIATSLDETTYDYTTVLDFNHEYRWKVVAKDGIFERESPLWRFYSIYPFGDPAPAIGEVGLPFDSVVFDWESDSSNEVGMTYDFYITTNEEDFSVSTTVAITTGIVETNYTYNDLLPDTQYFWKIVAINEDQTADSDVWTFKTRPAELMNWAPISGGTYDVGTPNADNFYDQETIGSFQLMDTEVTNLMYKIYLDDAFASGDITSGTTSGDLTSLDNVEGLDGTLYFEMSNLDSKITVPQGLTNTFIIEEGFEDHPVNFVSYYGAEAYAEHYNLRLPTEWEWEIAARGGGGGIEEYPWGNDDPVDETVANYRNSGDMYDNGTTPAGYYPAYHSLYDMAGNVWEWTSSEGDLVNDDGESYKILRGGSWNSTLPYLKCWVRNFDGTKNYDPDETYSIIGFRCAQ